MKKILILAFASIIISAGFVYAKDTSKDNKTVYREEESNKAMKRYFL